MDTEGWGLMSFSCVTTMKHDRPTRQRRKLRRRRLPLKLMAHVIKRTDDSAARPSDLCRLFFLTLIYGCYLRGIYGPLASARRWNANKA